MTRADALRAARALLDGMAGCWPDTDWHVSLERGRPDGHLRAVRAGDWDDDGLKGEMVCEGCSEAEAAHIARSCPARLGPVLRALMEGEE